MPAIARNRYPSNNPYDSKLTSLNLDPNKFNALLREYGIRVKHEKAVPCPNYKGNIDSGNHALNCPVCKESGFIFYPGHEFTALFQSNSLERMFRMQGFIDPGTASLTCPSVLEDKITIVYLHYFDRITLLDFEDRYSQLIHRGNGNIDLLRYTALQVEYLTTNNTTYTEGKEFIIDKNGNIEWISTNRPGYNEVPKYGEVYTISYLYRPVYRIVHMTHEGRFSQNKFKKPEADPMRFPQQVIIKKDFLMEKVDSTTGEKLKEAIVP